MTNERAPEVGSVCMSLGAIDHQTNDPTLTQLLPDWLRGVYVANTLNDAYQLREQLPEGGVLVTPKVIAFHAMPCVLRRRVRAGGDVGARR